MKHDPNNRKCPLWVFALDKLKATDLYDCKCPDHAEIRADNLQRELDEIKGTLRAFKELLDRS